MGKYMKKANVTCEVALMEVSQSSLGVRTRAKTLALKRRLQSSASAVDDLPPSNPDTCYLELRSRRLEKPPLLKQYLQRKILTPVQNQGVCADAEKSQPEKTRSGPGSNSIDLSKEENGCFEKQTGVQFEIGDSEIEACFGENKLELETRGRSTRESTPCNLITTPGSTTKKQRSLTFTNQVAQNALRNIPTTCEMEEFFTLAEHSQQQLFMEKYNFDVVNDMPLPGGYEWVRVMP